MWLLVNKFDTDKQWGDEVEFYSLGLKDEQLLIVSAEHGRGLEDLREKLSYLESSPELRRSIAQQGALIAKQYCADELYQPIVHAIYAMQSISQGGKAYAFKL